MDYTRLESMITNVVSRSVSQMQDQLLEQMASDPRFKGPAGPAGQPGPAGPKGDSGAVNINDLSPEQINQLAASIAAKLPAMGFEWKDESGKVVDRAVVKLGQTLIIDQATGKPK